MNMFLLPPLQRILEWRRFRQNLSNYEEFQQLIQTSKFWAQVPLQTYALDWDRAHTWPNAWQLIYEGNFDTIVVGILMEQTLILSGWDPKRLKLVYIKDTRIEDQMMILLIDNKWALNYSYQQVYDYQQIADDCTSLIEYQIYNGERIKV